jgi:hypothetical protein
MKRISILALLLTSTLFAGANSLLNIAVGVVWPDDIIMDSGNKIAWNSSAEWGKVIDKIIVVGAKVDFDWKVVSNRRPDESLIYLKNRSFMLPLSGWIAVDPLSRYRFHPFFHAQVGYNSLFYSETNYDDKSGNPLGKDIFKYYYGVFSKFGLDGVFDLGKEASIFFGYEYQIAPLYHKDGNSVESISVNGSGIRVGISILY